MDERLNKHGQLAVVVVGFFATIQLLLLTTARGSIPTARPVLTAAVAFAFAVRYWWVILLLSWPFSWLRLVLILAAWSALPVVAISMADAQRWVLALAGLSAIGFLTELYNGVTGQWRVGSLAMTRTLKRDHILGAASAAVASLTLVWAGLTLNPPVLERLLLAFVVADWIRLVVMIRQHQLVHSTDGSA
ncbi:MAG: hypothetical protein LH467_06785 [Gemmatimonadaceae bacterium]|nr:hypothetical protein [Gemmatimonadaceae bacterium]